MNAVGVGIVVFLAVCVLTEVDAGILKKRFEEEMSGISELSISPNLFPAIRDKI